MHFCILTCLPRGFGLCFLNIDVLLCISTNSKYCIISRQQNSYTTRSFRLPSCQIVFILKTSRSESLARGTLDKLLRFDRENILNSMTFISSICLYSTHTFYKSQSGFLKFFSLCLFNMTQIFVKTPELMNIVIGT